MQERGLRLSCIWKPAGRSSSPSPRSTRVLLQSEGLATYPKSAAHGLCDLGSVTSIYRPLFFLL